MPLFYIDSNTNHRTISKRCRDTYNVVAKIAFSWLLCYVSTGRRYCDFCFPTCAGGWKSTSLMGFGLTGLLQCSTTVTV